jgi:hypothetical protein
MVLDFRCLTSNNLFHTIYGLHDLQHRAQYVLHLDINTESNCCRELNPSSDQIAMQQQKKQVRMFFLLHGHLPDFESIDLFCVLFI